MTRSPKTAVLFGVILIEGYVVLATELLAIRQLIPFVGSGTETIAVIISAVLLPLAIGYHVGGQERRGIRRRLLRNILVALAILTFGLSYIFLELFFGLLSAVNITQPVVQAAVYALLLLSTPVFLLGQTVPLVSNYFGRRRISSLAGRMLFFSTIGSFLGSICSTLILMNSIGVHATVMVTLCLLGALVPLLSPRLLAPKVGLAALLAGLVLLMNNGRTLHQLGIVSDNGYNLVSVNTNARNGDRTLNINRSAASGIEANGGRLFSYIRYIEQQFIDPIAVPANTPRDMLILGAGGFTLGLDDRFNHYTFVDIDPALKTVAEAHFLPRPLGTNKEFVAQSARAFVRHATQQYDFILIDTFTHITSVPMETTTQEFLADAKKLLKPGGILVVNQIAAPDFSDLFSVRYDTTFSHVFHHYTRQVVEPYNPWRHQEDGKSLRNVLYIYYARPYNEDTGTYTDDKNTYSLDRH